MICPGKRAEVGALAEREPLALLPCLGRSVLAETLVWLAERGATQVSILASDRPTLIREAVGRGEAWGLQIEVLPERRELTVEEARQKYRQGDSGDWLPDGLDVVVLDPWPGDPAIRWWQGYASWRDGALALVPRAAANRVGVRSPTSGVHVGLRSQVASNARLIPPCWVGARAWIGPGAIVGPRTVVEDDAYVDEGARVSASLVGPGTYVGAWTNLNDSLAWGADLVSLGDGHRVVVRDPLLLGELRRKPQRRRSSWIGRAMALLLLLPTSPVVLWAAWKQRNKPGRLWLAETAVRGGQGEALDLDERCVYYRLAGVSGMAARWPQLWSIVRGDFAWFGNRPLSPEEAASLRSEVERLWLRAPTAVLSLADALGAPEGLCEETRAHACYYAVQDSRGSDLRILWQWLGRVLKLTAKRSASPLLSQSAMTIEPRGSTLLVRGVEELSSTTAAEFREQVSKALLPEHHSLDIDMSGLRFMDSTGLGVLAALHNALSENQGRVRILHPSSTAQQILELTRMHTVFEIVKKD